MILYLTFEEISALGSSAELVLSAARDDGRGIVAPPQFTAEIEQFAQQLEGDIPIETLADQRRMQRVVDHLLAGCRSRLDQMVLEQHAAAEDAVAAYFAYAHVLTVSRRLHTLGAEMAALLDLLAGDDDPDGEAARRFTFPD